MEETNKDKAEYVNVAGLPVHEMGRPKAIPLVDLIIFKKNMVVVLISCTDGQSGEGKWLIAYSRCRIQQVICVFAEDVASLAVK